MPKSPYEIAEAAMPGWKIVRTRQPRRKPRPGVDAGTPDLVDLKRRFLGIEPSQTDGLVAASTIVDDDTEYVVMERIKPGEKPRQKKVVVAHGKAIAVQG